MAEIVRLAEASYGHMVKAVVDVERKIMAVGGELHADAEAELLEDGSRQEDLWGCNIYPDQPIESRIEYTSLINIRSVAGNRSMEVKDNKVREQMRDIVNKLIG